MVRCFTGAVLVLGLSACSSNGVEWKNYAPDLQSRIDALASAKDCASLQEQFDNADANDDAQRSRTGSGNADLMGYIDDALKSADCYRK